MGSFSIGGLASGLDTKSIVDQLVQIEARPLTKMGWNKALWTARQNTWTDLNSRLGSLGTFAQQLISPSTWLSPQGVTSTDAAKVSGTANSPTPAVGAYALEVSQLAADEVWTAANALAPAVGGRRQSGTFYQGAFTEANGSTQLANLKDVDGTSLGLATGSVISMSASVNGTPVSANFTVGAGDTLDDLTAWAEGQFSGANFDVNPTGTINYRSGAGAANEITSLSFSATNGGSPLPVFNSTAGASSSFVSAPSGGTAAQTLTVTQGASTWNVAISAGADTSAIVSAINGTAGIGVTASVVGGKLQLASNVQGAAGDFSLSSTGSMLTDMGMAETKNGQDANFTVDGTAYTRTKNLDISDVITGVDLDLVALTTGPVTLNVTAGGSATPAGMKKKITDFVNQYNEVIDFINAKTGETKVRNPQNMADFLQGPMARDYRFSGVGMQLRGQVGDDVGGLPAGFSMLADIGISSGVVGGLGNTSGKLVIDDAKLDAALAADPAKVQDLFMRSSGSPGPADGDGIARRVSKMVSMYRVGGTVDAAMDGASAQVQQIQETMDRFSQRIDRKRAYFERMFSGLESRMGKMQSQGQWLSGQFASLS
jgi:flagellar hook-associated protein 2